MLLQMVRFHSFWGASNIVLCKCTVAFFFKIHLTVDGHLGCFHSLAFVNYTANSIGVHIYFELVFWVSSDKPPELLGHKAVSFLI